MLLSIKYPWKDRRIRARVSETGGIYWFAVDVYKILGFENSTKIISKYLANERVIRISNIVRTSKSNQYLLSFEQISKLLTNIPAHRQSKSFEKWITAVNTGDQKIYPSDPERLQKVLHFGPFHTNRCEIHFDTYGNNENEVTIPEILRDIKSKISDVEKFCNSVDTTTSMEHDDGQNNEPGSSCYGAGSGDDDHFNRSTFAEHKQLIDHSKSFVYKDECSQKTYEYIAIDLNWKSKEMKPLHIYPLISYEEKGAYLYVPFEKDLVD